MSLRLLLDEDTESKSLIRALSEAGHDVVTASETGLSGHTDEEVLLTATEQNRILITRNGEHYADLLNARRHTAGRESSESSG